MGIIGDQTEEKLHNFVHCTTFLASLHNSHNLRLVYSIATIAILQLESIYSMMRGLGECITIIVTDKNKIVLCKTTSLSLSCYNTTTKIDPY